MNINATAMRRIANKKLEEKRERIFDNAIAFIEQNIIEEATKGRFFYKFANPKELKIDNDEVVRIQRKYSIKNIKKFSFFT